MSWELPAILMAAAFGLMPFLARYESKRARARMTLWRRVAREVGLSDIVGWPDGDLTGSSGTLRVHLSHYHEDAGDAGTRLEITGARLAAGLALGPEALTHLHPKEMEVGDHAFDERVSVQGAAALALGLLDADMRRTVRSMVGGLLAVRGYRPLRAYGRLGPGVLWIDLPEQSNAAWRGWTGAVLDSEHELPSVLRAALDLAARLSVPEDLAHRLASNLATEPEAGVRRRIFLTLLREFPEHEATREAVRWARDDEDAEVRVPAAIALGAEGRDVLLRVALGEGAEDATAARAVAALGASLTIAQVGELLKNALRTRRLQTARQCLGILGAHGGEAIPSLTKVLLVENSELGEAAAAALAATGDPSAEAPLLRALAETAPEVRRAAAAALGRVGTREAVAPLRELEAAAPALRATARQAIAEIHARLAGAEQGQLSLAHGESGQLSLAEDEAGHLSLSDGGRTAPGNRDDPEGGRTGDAGPEPAQ